MYFSFIGSTYTSNMLSSTTHHLCSFLSIVAQLQYWLQSLCHELESCFFLLIVATSVVPSRLCCGVFFVAKSLRSESGWRVSWYSPQVFLLVEFNLTQLLLFTLFSQRGLSLLRLLELPSAIYISEQSAFAAAVNIKCITPLSASGFLLGNQAWKFRATNP